MQEKQPPQPQHPLGLTPEEAEVREKMGRAQRRAADQKFLTLFPHHRPKKKRKLRKLLRQRLQ